MTQREVVSHLLYVDPDPAYRRKIPSEFEPEWVVTTAESAEAATAAMDGSFDCVVAVDELPEMGGLAFFRSLGAETDELPFVLLGTEEDVDLLREAFRAGVTDVIYKRRSPGTTTEGVVFSTSVTRSVIWWQSRNHRFRLSEQVDYWTCRTSATP